MRYRIYWEYLTCGTQQESQAYIRANDEAAAKKGLENFRKEMGGMKHGNGNAVFHGFTVTEFERIDQEEKTTQLSFN